MTSLPTQKIYTNLPRKNLYFKYIEHLLFDVQERPYKLIFSADMEKWLNVNNIYFKSDCVNSLQIIKALNALVRSLLSLRLAVGRED